MLPIRQQFVSCRRFQPSIWISIRNISEKGTFDISENLVELMHGRKNLERRDSVTDDILLERQKHQERIKTIGVLISDIKLLTTLGMGSKKRRPGIYKISYNQYIDVDEGSYKKSTTGSGGFAVHVASASSDWPVLHHLLPEIVFAGHSNCGKSTLVNSMVGVAARKGPAAISNRAGWTDQICFYQLGKKPPLFTISDLPGYGHAVATNDEKRFWKTMIRDYLGTRQIISRCCVLVDCTRGLCDADYNFMNFLNKVGIEWKVVLTKCDLLSSKEVAQSIKAIDDDLIARYPTLSDPAHLVKKDFGTAFGVAKMIIPVSASTGAGVQRLWTDLSACAKASTSNPTEPNTSAVREHKNSDLVRRADLIRQLNEIKKKKAIREKTQVAQKDLIKKVN